MAICCGDIATPFLSILLCYGNVNRESPLPKGSETEWHGDAACHDIIIILTIETT
ncbi:MAG TPA: hypothetical protein VNM92_05890 [Thermoanaerobaculia bacterium]|nr:hypothetical protein [Thermoanaerobaculia bacterium]